MPLSRATYYRLFGENGGKLTDYINKPTHKENMLRASSFLEGLVNPAVRVKNKTGLFKFKENKFEAGFQSRPL